MNLNKLFGEDISITEEGFEAEVSEIMAKLQREEPFACTDCLETVITLLDTYRDMLESGEIDCTSLRTTLGDIVCHAVWKYAVMDDLGIYDTFLKLENTLIRKNKDYGNSSIKNGGLVGNYVRMSDKVSRLENLTSKKSTNYESLSDTWLDLAGYAVLGMIILKLTESVMGENG